MGIRLWERQLFSTAQARINYLQEFIDGDCASAVYLAGPDRVHLLGVTRQLVGEAWCNAGHFRYCGSIGPLVVSAATHDLLVRIGEVLTSAAGLCGLFGIDFILRDGVPWPVEVNPRYTASVEVLEYATGLCTMEWHARTFVGDAASVAKATTSTLSHKVGKAILFARQRIAIPREGLWSASIGAPVDKMPAFADIPHVGQVIEKGRPILTIFARAADEHQCLMQLRNTAAELTDLLHGESQ